MVRVPTRSLALALCECKNGHRRAPVPGRAARRRRVRRTGAGTHGGPAPGGDRASRRWRKDSDADADGVGLRSLLALDALEEHPLALVEALVAVQERSRVVGEDVLPAVDGDEAEALLGVEPLHGALCHVRSHVVLRADDPPAVEGPGLALPPVRSRAWNSNRARTYSTEWRWSSSSTQDRCRCPGGCRPPGGPVVLDATPSADEPRSPHRLQRRVDAVGEADDGLQRVEGLQALPGVEDDGLLRRVEPAVGHQLA